MKGRCERILKTKFSKWYKDIKWSVYYFILYICSLFASYNQF